MPYWRRSSFWSLLFVGWLVTSSILFILCRVALFFGNSNTLDWIIAAMIHIVAVISGWSFARQQMKPRETRGFPVITKSEKDAEID